MVSRALVRSLNYNDRLKYLKLLSTAIVLLTGNFISIKAQESVQRKQLFDNNWKFILGDSLSGMAVNFDDKSWRTLDLPHDWSIEWKTLDLRIIRWVMMEGISRQESVGTEKRSQFRYRGKINAFQYISRVFT